MLYWEDARVGVDRPGGRRVLNGAAACGDLASPVDGGIIEVASTVCRRLCRRDHDRRAVAEEVGSADTPLVRCPRRSAGRRVVLQRASESRVVLSGLRTLRTC